MSDSARVIGINWNNRGETRCFDLPVSGKNPKYGDLIKLIKSIQSDFNESHESLAWKDAEGKLITFKSTPEMMFATKSLKPGEAFHIFTFSNDIENKASDPSVTALTGAVDKISITTDTDDNDKSSSTIRSSTNSDANVTIDHGVAPPKEEISHVSAKQCIKCGFKTAGQSREKLKIHVAQVHLKMPYLYACPKKDCFSSYTKSKIDTHMKNHEKKRRKAHSHQ